LAAGLLLYNHEAFAQFGLPRLPGAKRNKDSARGRKAQSGGDEGSAAAGAPVPMDSPVFEAFRRMEQQPVYHQRIKFVTSDPQMERMLAQMGMTPAETTVAGDTRQVSMRFQMPVMGQVEDFELRAISRNGRLAKKWSSPASGRILKAQDAAIAKQLAQAEESAARSIARNLAAGGPMGLLSAGVSAAGAAASVAAAARVRKQAHEFFEWACMDGGAPAADHRDPPPLTDLKATGDQTLDGLAVTGYEFFVKQGGRFQGPVQLFVAKETGLPFRIAMSDPRAGGGMQMDYSFNPGGEIEIPACLDGK
jgi:hypothetical protein